MSMSILCPGCSKNLKVPDKAAGHKVKCPSCGTALTIPSQQQVTAPSLDLPRPTTVTPRPSARKSSRPLLFVAVGGGALAVLLLAVVLILAFRFRGAKSSVEVSVNWKTPNGVDFDDNPVAVLIPKGMKQKIDVIAPIYAGEDYEKVEGPQFRKCGAYLTVGAGGKAWFENIPHGGYVLIVFPNSFASEIDEGIGEDEAQRAEQQLQPFFTRVRLDWLRKKPALVRNIEVMDRVVDVRHEFSKRGNQGQAQQPRKAEPVRTKADLKVTADDLLAAIQANQLDAERKYKGKTLEVTGLVEKVDTAPLPELDPQYFVWLRENDKTAGSIRCGFSKFFDGFPALERGPNYKEGGEELNRKGGAGILVTVLGQLVWRENEPRLAACSMVTTEDEIIVRLKAKAAAEKDASNQAERTAEEAVKKAEAMKVNPSDLAAGNANFKFGGKVVEITATVKGVRKGRYDEKTRERLIIDLEYDKKPDFDRGPVACSFSLRHADTLAKVRPGQTVTIRGRCDEALPDFLWHCALLKAD